MRPSVWVQRLWLCILPPLLVTAVAVAVAAEAEAEAEAEVELPLLRVTAVEAVGAAAAVGLAAERALPRRMAPPCHPLCIAVQ